MEPMNSISYFIYLTLSGSVSARQNSKKIARIRPNSFEADPEPEPDNDSDESGRFRGWCGNPDKNTGVL